MRSTDRFSIGDVKCEFAGGSHAVADLSVGGFFVAADSPLPVGQSIAFEIVFPDGWRAPGVGRVAWVNGPEGTRRPNLPAGFGLSITKIAFTDKLALVARLRDAMRQPEPAVRAGRPAGPVPVRARKRRKH